MTFPPMSPIASRCADWTPCLSRITCVQASTGMITLVSRSRSGTGDAYRTVSCHWRLSAELRERLGLPYSPGSKPPARPVDKAGPPKVWLGEAFADLEVEGPSLVIMHTGEIRYVPAGRRG
jgi:hypothetical protein